jgi:3-methylcrotonyl-CoA carboxylase alpha subunit
MIAKLTVHGPTRAVALRKLERALAETEVAGTVTNIAFLRALARHSGFGAGAVDTGLIDRDLPALSRSAAPCSRTCAIASVAASGVLDQGSGPWQGFALWAPLERDVEIGHAGARIHARISVTTPGVVEVLLEAATHTVARDGAQWRIDGAPVSARPVRHGTGLSVFWGNAYHFDLVDPLARDEVDPGTANLIEAPMPGLVKAVFVKPGAVVEKGARLAVLEAMKMEHTLSAARDGVVAEVRVSAGMQVEAGAALILLAEQEEAAQ